MTGVLFHLVGLWIKSFTVPHHVLGGFFKVGINARADGSEHCGTESRGFLRFDGAYFAVQDIRLDLQPERIPRAAADSAGASAEYSGAAHRVPKSMARASGNKGRWMVLRMRVLLRCWW